MEISVAIAVAGCHRGTEHPRALRGPRRQACLFWVAALPRLAQPAGLLGQADGAETEDQVVTVERHHGGDVAWRKLEALAAGAKLAKERITAV